MGHGQIRKEMAMRALICSVSLQSFLAGVVATFLFAPAESLAAPGDLIRTFADPSGSNSSGFGDAVTGVDGYVFVGAESPWLSVGGVVHMFDPGSGVLERTFNTPTPGYMYGGFGRTIADFQGNLLVGAWQEPSGLNIFDIYSGARLDAYPNTGWLGISAAVDGTQILAGAAADTTSGNWGKAYLFDGSTHATLQTYTPPVPAVRFGEAVAFAGDHVVIGAIGYNDVHEWSGAAFVFDRATGTYLHTFLNPVPGRSAYFGGSVAAAGDDILIGKFNTSEAVYTLRRFHIRSQARVPGSGLGE